MYWHDDGIGPWMPYIVVLAAGNGGGNGPHQDLAHLKSSPHQWNLSYLEIRCHAIIKSVQIGAL